MQDIEEKQDSDPNDGDGLADPADIADQILFGELQEIELEQSEVRPDAVEKARRRVQDDAIRGDGSISRDDVNRAYVRLALTIAECAEVEQFILANGIVVIDDEGDDDSHPRGSSPSRQRYLSAADEVALARKIQIALRLQNANEVYDEEFTCRAIDEAEAARRIFVSTNQRWVWKLVRGHGQNKHLQDDDLFQEGMLGLLKATTLFDPDRGFRFKTYATWWIEQHIRRAIDNDDREVRLPVHLQEKLRRIRKTQRQLWSISGKEPNLKMLSDTLGMEQEALGKLLWRIQATDCVEGDSEIGDGATIFKTVADDSSIQQDELLARAQLGEQIREALRSLTAREERILRLRFGFDGDKSHTLETIGIQFGLTRERIRQIEAKALRRLKHPTRSRRLRPFLDQDQ